MQSGQEETSLSGLAKGSERDKALLDTSLSPNLVSSKGGGLIRRYSPSSQGTRRQWELEASQQYTAPCV